MRTHPLRVALHAAAAATLVSCSDEGAPTAPSLPVPAPSFAEVGTLPSVHFSEIHYDNDGTDTGEAIEISAPAGTDLTGWQVVLYNGNGGAGYGTTTLSGTVPATCDARGVVVVDYPSNGIQNGGPDGLALVDAGGTVVEFLSYEGTFAATDGPAAGLTSTDIGVSEASSTPVGQSLQRGDSGTWTGPTESTFGACNTVTPPPPPPSDLPETRISELHYDNDGADVGEGLEVEGPAGANVEGWSLVLYNGNGGGAYATLPLTGTIPATCTDRGVVVVPYAGIQNGSPDGVALVDAGGTVVEFLSWEGTFDATDGAAAGATSTDLGVSEASDTPAGLSLQRDATGAWYGPAPQTFGTCNGDGTPPPPPPPSDAPIVIDELLASPLRASGGASWGEWFEVYNAGADPIDLQGWTIASNGQADHVIASSVVVPAGGWAVLGRGDDPARNGGVTLDYNYYTGSSTIWLDDADKLVLRDPAGGVADSVQWSAGTMVRGATRALKDPASDHADVDATAWGYSTVPFGDGDFGTPGAANGTLSDTPPAIPGYVTFSGRLASDPPLPVGFEDQIFATLRDGTGASVPTTFTWTSETPSIATIDADGVLHALAEGTATVRATAEDGTTATYALPTVVAAMSTSAEYGDNTEFGDPVDADPGDDYIVRRPEYTTSYNAARGTPNWVAYDLDASHFGAEDRCDCFTFDPELPAGFTHLTTNDYTGAGAAAGYGIDRGHLARSFDRTAGPLDNATTYYLSNIIPQAADLNQGPWASLENDLGDLARAQDKEVYIVAGVAGSLGTVKDEGRIVIPESVWKVALILPRDEGLADVRRYVDAQVIAVIMPNTPGVRNVDWHVYETTVDAVEAASGYDLLAALPDGIERALESGAQPPIAATDGPWSGLEGGPIAMSGAASLDPNGSVLSWSWSFGDGATATGAQATHVYAQDGDYEVTLVVTDDDALVDSATVTAHVANVAPEVGPLPADTLLPGGLYEAAGTFTDPGHDPWSATVDWGDGSGVLPLDLDGRNFHLSHAWCTAGDYTVGVSVQDDDDAGSTSAAVTVLTPKEALAVRLVATVEQLVEAGRISPSAGRSIVARLEAAAGTPSVLPMRAQLRAMELFLELMVRVRRLPPDAADALRDAIGRIEGCLAG